MKKQVPASYKKSSFGPAFLFLDPSRRRALAAYYSFCRLMDDIADEPSVPQPEQELIFWREEIARIYQGRPQTELGKELQPMVQAFGMPEDRFLLLIEGMEADLQGRRYKTFEDLSWYLYRVAVIVGLATLDILGVKGPRAQRLALALGGAVQLTNIVRDVHEDAAMGRVYLPQEWLAENQLTEEDVLKNTQPAKLAQVLERMSVQARKLYRQAQEEMKSVAWRKALPCRVMGWVYSANLAKIEKTGFIFSRQIKLTRGEKLKQIFYAIFNKEN